MVTLLLLTSLSLAADLGFAAGGQVSLNDPFQRSLGARASGIWTWTPALDLEVGLVGFPGLGQGNWKPLTEQLVSENHVAPSLSCPRWQAHLVAVGLPIQGSKGALQSRTGFYGGFGLVQTVEDLEMLQSEGDPQAESTQTQWHGSPVWGVTSEVGGALIRARVRLESTLYVETVWGTSLERKDNRSLVVEVLWP